MAAQLCKILHAEHQFAGAVTEPCSSFNTAGMLQVWTIVCNDRAQVTTGADKTLRMWNHVERRVELCREFGEVRVQLGGKS